MYRPKVSGILGLNLTNDGVLSHPNVGGGWGGGKTGKGPFKKYVTL
jgi:hypothetical protein